MQDVKSPIDLKEMDDARQWAAEVMLKRPYRTEIFKLFSHELHACNARTVIELGSGPGFLASEILSQSSNMYYSAYDFSPAMHQLARERLGVLANGVNFITGSFTEKNWQQGLGQFDAIVTIQAVHEVRHKNNTGALFEVLPSLLTANGVFLYCDHVCDKNGMANADLFMNEHEQYEALHAAQFSQVEKLTRIGSLALWKCKV